MHKYIGSILYNKHLYTKPAPSGKLYNSLRIPL